MITRSSLQDVPIATLKPYQKNPRRNDPAVKPIARSLQAFGYVKTSIGIDENNELLYGHTTLKAAKSLKWKSIPEVTQIVGLTEDQKKAYRLADNKLGELAEWDDALLHEELLDLTIAGFDLDIAGFDPSMVLPENHPAGGAASIAAARKTLKELFLIPPFSILDARQGYWQDRKRAWMALGIKSELGRGGDAVPSGSLRPVVGPDGKIWRSDGHARPLRPNKMAMQNDPMVRKHKYDDQGEE